MSARRVVYGVQPVREVLRVHGSSAGPLHLAEPLNPKLEGIARLADKVGAERRRSSRAELDRMTKGGMHQGALIEAPPLRIQDEDALLQHFDENPAALALCLDGIMDPQNFGAVVRAAVGIGDAWVVWPEHGSAPLSPATFRASAGAIEHASLARVRSLPTLFNALRDLETSVVLLEGSSDTTLDAVDLTGRVALVLGSEDRGAKPASRKAASVRAKLPMSGKIDSLNASVAAALAIYETCRQRRHISNT
jgi:23S rRNA (guanosine2251-2'-O)-methyltransferase